MRAFAPLALLVSVLGCSSSEEAGIEVTFALAQSTPAELGADDGRAIALTHGSLALGSIELVSCDGFTPSESHGHSTGLELQHTEGSPTLLGSSAILPLEAQGAGASLGTVQPPPGTYCAVRQHFFAADDDAEGLTDEGDVGATLVATGTVGGAPFTLRTAATLDVEVTLEPSLDLSLTGLRTATLELTMDPTANWLAGVTFAAGQERADADLALANMHHVVGARVKP